MKTKLQPSAIKLSLLLTCLGATSFAQSPSQEELAQTPSESQQSIISDGSAIKFDNGAASIVPVVGWEVVNRGLGMSLLMKEVLPKVDEKSRDYSKPIFARNISVVTINEASPIDEKRAESFKADFVKMSQKMASVSDFKFTSHKFFNYKGENDGIVFFADHVSNNFQMQQMFILVSGEHKQYVLIYTDLASNFAKPETYDQAWRSMTSIIVPGVAPVRYQKEAAIGGGILGALLILIVPMFVVRMRSAYRLKRIADEMQAQWDNGKVSGADEFSNISQMQSTKIAGKMKSQSSVSFVTGVSSAASNLSTRKSSFSDTTKSNVSNL